MKFSLPGTGIKRESRDLRRWTMRLTVFASAALLALGLPIATFAAGGGADPPRPAAVTPAVPADPNFAQAKAMIEARNYAARCRCCSRSSAQDPRNADAYNLMGFATRVGQPHGSLQYYTQALAIDPKHLGAHEYLGEAYLMLDSRPRPTDAGAARFALRLRLHRVPHAQGGDRQLPAGQEADQLSSSRRRPAVATTPRAL
jgi:hypothetical protein